MAIKGKVAVVIVVVVLSCGDWGRPSRHAVKRGNKQSSSPFVYPDRILLSNRYLSFPVA